MLWPLSVSVWPTQASRRQYTPQHRYRRLHFIHRTCWHWYGGLVPSWELPLSGKWQGGAFCFQMPANSTFPVIPEEECRENLQSLGGLDWSAIMAGKWYRTVNLYIRAKYCIESALIVHKAQHLLQSGIFRSIDRNFCFRNGWIYPFPQRKLGKNEPYEFCLS